MDEFPKDYVPSDQELRTWAMELVAGQSTMTLATAREGIPWAASVYYVNLEFAFYFFSDPESRHVREATEGGHASAAVFFSPASTWRDIRGLQMSGRVSQLKPSLEAIKAVSRYAGKFPFVKEFFGPGETLDLGAFSKAFRVRFFRFQPDLVYYLDNRIRFSFREKVAL